MTWRTYGRSSVTLPHGIRFPTRQPSLNALAVVCHGWKSDRSMPAARPSCSAAWISPLCRWTRPVRRAA